MFQSARIKLTLWYLLIIMFISIAFSAAIYRVLIGELARVERVQRLRRSLQLPSEFRRPVIDPEVLTESENRLKAILILVNLSVLGMAGVAGYFLAGRTLQPIQKMVDEQSRFITDASHELRTPLTSLKSEIEVNLRDKNLTLVGTKKLLQSNLEEVNNLQYLSDNLIKLTQYQKTNDRQFFEKTSLSSVINEACRKVINLAKHKNIAVLNRTKDYNVMADRQSLIELFVIFLDNAIKYSPSRKKVTISTKKTDHSVAISITDQGIGIAEKDLPHLFDRFYRADKSRTKTEVGGYGLGLSIAKQIAEKHLGAISVNSKKDQGSTFTVSLPLKD